MSTYYDQFIVFITPYWDRTIILATSWLAWRIYVVVIAAVVLGASFWVARKQQVWFKNLNPVSPIRGRQATRIKTLKRQIVQIDDLKKNIVRAILVRAGVLLATGLLVPGFLVVLALYNYQWFVPGGHALLADQCGGGPVDLPTISGISSFVASQWSMGFSPAAFGSLESAERIRTSLHTYVPGDPVVSMGLSGFRYFVALFSGTFFAALWSAVRGAPSSVLDETKKKLQERLLEAQNKSAEKQSA